MLRLMNLKDKKGTSKSSKRYPSQRWCQRQFNERRNSVDGSVDDDSNNPPLLDAASPCSSTGSLDATRGQNGAEGKGGGGGGSEERNISAVTYPLARMLVPQEEEENSNKIANPPDLSRFGDEEGFFMALEEEDKDGDEQFATEQFTLKSSSPQNEANEFGGGVDGTIADGDESVAESFRSCDGDESVAESFRSCVSKEQEPGVFSMVETFCDIGVVIEREAGRLEAGPGHIPSSSLSVASSVSASSFRTAFDASCSGSVTDLGLSIRSNKGSSSFATDDDASFATALSIMSSSTDRVFVSMPRRLIRSGHLTQALSVLGDGRYILQRIQKLGVVLAAELMASDCECFQRRVHKLKSGRAAAGRRRDEGAGGTTDSLSQIMIGGTTSSSSSILRLFDLFQRHVVESCRSYLVPTATASVEDAPSTATMSSAEGGKALYMLGSSLDKRGMVDKAMSYYRHALGLFLAQVGGGVGMKMFDDTRRELGLGPGVDYETIRDAANSSNDDGHEQLEHLDIGRTLTHAGDLHAESGQLDEAGEAYSAALAHFDRAIVCFETEVRQLQSNGENEKADSLVDLITTARTEYCGTLFRLGTSQSERNDIRAAITTYQRALVLEVSLLGYDSNEVADTHYNLGSLYSRVANLDVALQHYGRALAIRRATLGREHLDVARALYHVGAIHRRREDFKKATTCFREIISTQESVLGGEHPLVKLASISLAATLKRSR